jgi:hypothetical protein
VLENFSCVLQLISSFHSPDLKKMLETVSFGSLVRITPNKHIARCTSNSAGETEDTIS